MLRNKVQQEQRSMASTAASIYHSKQNHIHISAAASQLRPLEPLGYNSWQTPEVTEARNSLPSLCVVLGDASGCSHDNQGSRGKRWPRDESLERGVRGGLGGMVGVGVSFNSPQEGTVKAHTNKHTGLQPVTHSYDMSWHTHTKRYCNPPPSPPLP